MKDHLLDSRRHLDLDGGYNIRDLGGYETEDGRRTRWRTFLRAGTLHKLPRQSQDALIGYGVRTVVDLRRTVELEAAPNVFANRPEVLYRHENMMGDEFEETDVSEIVEPAESIYQSYYTGILDTRQSNIRAALGALADPDAHGALYHCAAGKDRTGIVSALLLGLAGVSSHTIADDYGLSARYLVDRYLTRGIWGGGGMHAAPPDISAAEYTWETYQDQFCPPGAMRRVLQHLADKYGGIEAYVRAIGVTSAESEAIRAAFVE